jgi:GH15 family glucan-1,4-alpha-glucosidase
MDLLERSVEIIVENQARSGAYVASPNFPTYHYSWFRDGAFCAYAMDLSGRHESAGRFHDWAARAVLEREALIRWAVAKVRRGQPLDGADVLHTRYELDGSNGTDTGWPNFQLDGFGTWLWGLDQHFRLSGRAPAADTLKAAGLVQEYLTALWNQPCYDCWEEFPSRIHPHTLAAIHAGLEAASRLTGANTLRVCAQIRAWIEREACYDGYFVKFNSSHTVDASLIGLAVPYGLFRPDDLRIKATIQRIETSLVRGGGVHRYPTDTYYGGGEWVLLAAWLGWYYAESGNRSRAEQLLAWVEAQSNRRGELPEQIPATLNDLNEYQPWVSQWGEIATPLLWSHAMYIILCSALQL